MSLSWAGEHGWFFFESKEDLASPGFHRVLNRDHRANHPEISEYYEIKMCLYRLLHPLFNSIHNKGSAKQDGRLLDIMMFVAATFR